MSKLLLALLASFLTLGADPPDEPDAGAGDPPDDPDGDLPDLGEDESDEPDGEGEGEGEADPDDPDTLRAQLKAEKTARETAERNAREAADRAAAAERARTATPPLPSHEQQIFEQEETRLKDPAITAQEKWQIESNRVLRSNTRAAMQAQQTAQDMADKAEFDRMLVSSPGLKRYTERVEKKLTELRGEGKNMPRALIARFLIGDDVVSGKVKSTKRDRSDPAKPVPRGKPASARGDVAGRGAKSEHEKRKARLENQII